MKLLAIGRQSTWGVQAAPTGNFNGSGNSTAAEYDLLEERAVPNPKNPNFEKGGSTTAKTTTATKTAKTVALEASTTPAVSPTTTPVPNTTTAVVTTTTAVAPSVHTGQATFFYQDSADNGKSVVAVVADACPGCATYYSLDLSTGAFEQIGDKVTGALPISWYFLAVGYSPSSQSTTTKSIAPTTAKAKTTTKTSTSVSVTPSPTPAPTTYTGQGTFFFQGGKAGACGIYNKDSTPLVALDYRLYGDTDAQSKYCGKYLHITNTANGKSVVAIVADACPTCASKYSLDLSTGAYDKIGDRDTGILPISWYWI
ncbi:hypothetical protein MVLG_04138 [Microbotryum lychnidis-dioicae p1A1 Lamole]|uniref:RlpA-like protein double-psi beta-barrel domain-containing protein n=1 Tax=Microbotryum lychnidis-dioicae (strain p1A1 Lamole / MvSl-1064) TaxID=683840 RepID=U5HAA6_USTV1|nr:hypothetical protein MVLG_04138 [Microbotryum lychnidis-dioicae p1A1 Lamole]|eukprot:KDE05448.1 hypothetical protein MVLG_04138 [Microbotryum lychnidis-dioicae p1A1 Lamole]